MIQYGFEIALLEIALLAKRLKENAMPELYDKMREAPKQDFWFNLADSIVSLKGQSGGNAQNLRREVKMTFLRHVQGDPMHAHDYIALDMRAKIHKEFFYRITPFEACRMAHDVTATESANIMSEITHNMSDTLYKAGRVLYEHHGAVVFEVSEPSPNLVQSMLNGLDDYLYDKDIPTYVRSMDEEELETPLYKQGPFGKPKEEE